MDNVVQLPASAAKIKSPLLPASTWSWALWLTLSLIWVSLTVLYCLAWRLSQMYVHRSCIKLGFNLYFVLLTLGLHVVGSPDYCMPMAKSNNNFWWTDWILQLGITWSCFWSRTHALRMVALLFYFQIPHVACALCSLTLLSIPSFYL